MKNETMKELSTDQLLKIRKTAKVITYMLSGTLALLFCLTLFKLITKGFSGLSVIPIALLPILLLNFKNLNDITKELRSRNIN